MPTSVEIRPLARTDRRDAFTCGNEDLDVYFRTQAGQQVRKGLAGVLVASMDGEVAGFATSTTVEFDRAMLPGNPPKTASGMVPVLRLVRLGVAVHFQGQGIGGQLLRRVFEEALDLRTRHGCVGVLVDAKPSAISYYEKYEFTALPETDPETSTRPMFLPISTIQASRP